MRICNPHELIGKRQLNEYERKNVPSELYLEGPMSIPIPTPRVSVVGTRRPSTEGRNDAKTLTKMLVNNKVTIISGLAMGIDTVAHTTAMEMNGKTVAVIGTSLDKQYPKPNYRLQEEIAKRHLLVSQFPIGSAIRKGNFVARNRTMALLSNATVIVEAGEGSGTIHQGWEALRLRRPLFIYRSVIQKGVEWASQMVKYGAIILDNFKDIRYELPFSPTLANVSS